MKVFDSSFWVAFFDISDSQHEKAEKMMREEPFLAITEYCFVETASVLAKKAGAEAAKRFFEFIGSNSDISILYSTENFFRSAGVLFCSVGGPKLSFVDVSLLYLSHSHEVVTFDKALEKEIRKLQR